MSGKNAGKFFYPRVVIAPLLQEKVNYLCIYRLLSDTVYVYHIADGRTDYPKLMQDLS
jgi:hypothetical protein